MSDYYRTRNTPNVRAYHIWNNARKRAKKNDIPFTITLDWLKERLDRCAVTGIELDTSIGPGSGNGNPFAPSLDQITPRSGYTPENTQVVCWIYNCAKGSARHEEVARMARVLINPQVG